jgi:hypothetical protein
MAGSTVAKLSRGQPLPMRHVPFTDGVHLALVLDHKPHTTNRGSVA